MKGKSMGELITLALETSTPRGGVALFRDGEMIFSESFTADRSHSAELFTVIERALAAAGHPQEEVARLAISTANAVIRALVAERAVAAA